MFSELSVQVQTYLKALAQLEAHLSHILLFETFSSFATNSPDSRMKEKVETGRAMTFFCKVCISVVCVCVCNGVSRG